MKPAARRRRRTLRAWVFARDAGVCVEPKCRLDTVALQKRIEALPLNGQIAVWDVLEKEGFDRARPLWEADHELALDEGGKDELENIVTRCVPCHKGKTKEQAARKARIRKLVGRKFLGEQPKKRKTAK